MFILSQNKKKLAPYEIFDVSKNYGGKKEEKYCLVGIVCSFWGKDTTILGTYSSEENVIEELENIFTAIKNGESVYAVK